MSKRIGLFIASTLLLLPMTVWAKKGVPTNTRKVMTKSELSKKLPQLVRAQRADAGSSWRITPGDWSRQLDAVSIVNTGAHMTEVWIHQRDAEGNIIKAARIAPELLPNGRLGYVIGGPEGSEFTYSKESTFEISGVQKMSVQAWRGTLNAAGDISLVAASAERLSKSETSRDAVGVWYINGGSLYDVAEMQGYNEATDRLFQGYFYKMLSRGRFAEIFGADFLSQDMLARSAGYSEDELLGYYEALDDESRAYLDGYTDGLNRRVAEVNSNPALIPVEFLALGVVPIEPWSVTDVMAWVSTLQRNFSSLGNLGLSQVENALLLLELVDAYGGTDGINVFQDLRWTNDPQAPTMIPASEAQKKRAATRQRAALDLQAVQSAPDLRDWYDAMNAQVTEARAALDSVGANVKGGSYAWVVAGSKTSTGNPIIYSGPQMGFESPAIVMEGSIISDDANMHVSGMTVVGIPGIIIGRTPHHAWSMQVGHTNTWDWYLESEDTIAVSHFETILVNGGEPVTIPILRSSHGPVFEQAGMFLSWKYSSWGKEWDLQGGSLGLARAQSMDEFDAAIAKMAVTQHYCYADRDGNIAYWMSGQRPVRPEGEYRLPQGFLGPALEWDQDVLHPPINDRNTSQGWYAGWNNKAHVDLDDTSANYLYGRYHRAEVPQKIMRESGVMTFEQIRDMAVDISTTQAFGSGSGSGGGSTWPWLGERFTAEAEQMGEETAALIHELFDDWDQHRVAGGPAAWVLGQDVADAWVLLDLWSQKVLDKMFDDELGNSGNNSFRLQLLIREIHKATSVKRNGYRLWARNADPAAGQTLSDHIQRSLAESLAELGPRPWGVGARGTLEYPHPLLGTFFPGTPWAARSTYAHCVEYDAQGPVRIESVFPTGQDGNLYPALDGSVTPSPGYFSMKLLYDTFTLRPFPLFDRGEE